MLIISVSLSNFICILSEFLSLLIDWIVQCSKNYWFSNFVNKEARLAISPLESVPMYNCINYEVFKTVKFTNWSAERWLMEKCCMQLFITNNNIVWWLYILNLSRRNVVSLSLFLSQYWLCLSYVCFLNEKRHRAEKYEVFFPSLWK